VQVLFLNLGEVAQRVKNTFEKETKQQDSTLFEDMKKVELLVIDDIGVEKVSDWLAEQIYLVVNHRYENRLPMIVTSNQSLEDLARTHRPQICSRLQEMCRVVKFTGTDRRKDLRPTF
jgi:DNA replication protein DnaC